MVRGEVIVDVCKQEKGDKRAKYEDSVSVCYYHYHHYY